MHGFYLPKVANRPIQSLFNTEANSRETSVSGIFTRQPEIGV